MATLSRSAFLGVLATTGAFVLAGCGGGTNNRNSTYTGSYRSVYTLPSLGETGIFSFTVDVKGNLSGTLDDQKGTIREVTGSLNDNGGFDAGTLNRAGSTTTGRISGTMSSPAKTQALGAPPEATPVTGGSFSLTETGKSTAAGSFQVTDEPVALPSPTPAPVAAVSEYQGFYSGIYNLSELSQNGNTSFTVDSTGKMTGLLTRNNETGTLNGTLTNGGGFTATVTFKQAPTTITLAGTLAKTTDRSTLGNFTLTQNSTSYAGLFGPTIVNAGTSPYAGSYRGTYSIPEGGEDGAISFTVDPAGAISGFFSQNNNSPVGTFTGAFNNDASFAGTVSYETSTGLAPRPITGRVGTSTLSGERAGDFVITINGVARAGNFEASTPSSNPDSNYRASYSSGNLPGISVSFGGVPSNIAVDSEFNSFSVDKQGSIIGTIGGYPMTGRVNNDARITGTFVGANGKTYPFRGIINKLNFTFLVKVSDEVPASVGPPPAAAIPAKYEEKTRPGISADLIFSVEGKEYNGLLQSLGGDGVTK